MKPETINQLEKLFLEAPILCGEPVGDKEITAAEASLDTQFPADYKEFLSLYGGGIVGAYPILGLRKVEPMGVNTWSVVEVNQQYKRHGWPGVEGMLIISIDHNGNPMGIPYGSEEVIVSDHEFGGTYKLAENFEDFLLRCISGPWLNLKIG